LRELFLFKDILQEAQIKNSQKWFRTKTRNHLHQILAPILKDDTTADKNMRHIFE